MDKIDLTGHWTGTIIYGKSYSRIAGKELYFDMELVQSGNEFAGNAIDTGGFGVNPDEAYILGSVKDLEINFLKQYNSSHYYSLKDNETKINKKKRGPKIKYNGIYNLENDTITGEWQINVTVLFLYILPLRFKSSGTWNMTRK